MLAGGSEMATTRMGLGGFGQAKALSTRNDSPQEASRPWDKDRDGFVLSDGGGAMVLEDLDHARARGARIYAELAGFGMSGDAHHITSPPEDGNGARRAMQSALKDAALNPGDVQYVNAHATSTNLGDLAETQAIKGAFGEQAYKLAVSSTKSVTGHLLGAAGVLEAILTTLAIRDQVAPGTMNLYAPDEGCDLDYVPLAARKMRIDAALSNSLALAAPMARWRCAPLRADPVPGELCIGCVGAAVGHFFSGKKQRPKVSGIPEGGAMPPEDKCAQPRRVMNRKTDCGVARLAHTTRMGCSSRLAFSLPVHNALHATYAEFP